MGCIPSPYRGYIYRYGSCDYFSISIIIFIGVIELFWIFKYIGRNSIACLLLLYILNSLPQYTGNIVSKFLPSPSLPCSSTWHST